MLTMATGLDPRPHHPLGGLSPFTGQTAPAPHRSVRRYRRRSAERGTPAAAVRDPFRAPAVIRRLDRFGVAIDAGHVVAQIHQRGRQSAPAAAHFQDSDGLAEEKLQMGQRMGDGNGCQIHWMGMPLAGR